MPSREVPEKFLVAFSFAGEQRDLTRNIASAVERRLGSGTVFLDEWFEHYIAGQDADIRLQKIYGERSELVVVCVSQKYGGKPWTLMEHEAIRARLMKLRASEDERDRQRVLPVRVGEGDIDEIPFNTLVPDVRDRDPERTADLIVDRLGLVRALAALPPAGGAALPRWPVQPIPFPHGLADRAVREWPAVLQLLTADSARRILTFKGPSGFSKSALLRAAARYAKLLHVPTAFVDFKDTALLSEVSVLRELQVGLGQVLPEFAAQDKPDRWRLRGSLRALQVPALIILDTYEKVTNAKELVEWIETQLLKEVEECASLRFLIGGQEVPESKGAPWHAYADGVELNRIHDQRIWKEWVHQINPNVEEKHVEGIVLGLEGVPGNISTALEACARNLARPG